MHYELKYVQCIHVSYIYDVRMMYDIPMMFLSTMYVSCSICDVLLMCKYHESMMCVWCI